VCVCVYVFYFYFLSACEDDIENIFAKKIRKEYKFILSPRVDFTILFRQAKNLLAHLFGQKNLSSISASLSHSLRRKLWLKTIQSQIIAKRPLNLFSRKSWEKMLMKSTPAGGQVLISSMFYLCRSQKRKRRQSSC